MAAVMAASHVAAQEIEPNEFTPLPAGANVVLGYYGYGHGTEFNIAGGPTIKRSGIEVNIGVARYVHFVDVAGLPAGVQIYQPIGGLSGGHIGARQLNDSFGAQNTTLSAFVFPYADQTRKTYFDVSAFLYPPDGTYDRHAQVNLGDNRWRGDIQLGLTKGIGTQFSFDAAFDTQFYGDNDQSAPGSLRLSQEPTLRGQLWASWNWTNAFRTSVGWEGLFGGQQRINGTVGAGRTEEQRIRAAVSYFLTPAFQGLLELNHDLRNAGGFKQEFGTTLRVLYVF